MCCLEHVVLSAGVGVRSRRRQHGATISVKGNRDTTKQLASMFMVYGRLVYLLKAIIQPLW